MGKKLQKRKEKVADNINLYLSIGTFADTPPLSIATVQRTNRSLKVKGTFLLMACKANGRVKRWHRY